MIFFVVLLIVLIAPLVYFKFLTSPIINDEYVINKNIKNNIENVKNINKTFNLYRASEKTSLLDIVDISRFVVYDENITKEDGELLSKYHKAIKSFFKSNSITNVPNCQSLSIHGITIDECNYVKSIEDKITYIKYEKDGISFIEEDLEKLKRIKKEIPSALIEGNKVTIKSFNDNQSNKEYLIYAKKFREYIDTKKLNLAYKELKKLENRKFNVVNLYENILNLEHIMNNDEKGKLSENFFSYLSTLNNDDLEKIKTSMTYSKYLNLFNSYGNKTNVIFLIEHDVDYLNKESVSVQRLNKLNTMI